MKTQFKKSETKFGCYSSDTELLSTYPSKFTIQDVLNSNTPLRDKFWFVRNNCQLSGDQYRKLAIEVATIVLPIYEAKYPENKAPRLAIQAACLILG